MTTRRTSALIAVVGAVVVSVALFAGSASATLPPPGGGGVCSNYASGTTTFAMAVATTACYSYEVGFYAYNPDNTITLFDWAYEATPNTPILAGVVPEPSTCLFLWFGTLSIVLFRKRNA